MTNLFLEEGQKKLECIDRIREYHKDDNNMLFALDEIGNELMSMDLIDEQTILADKTLAREIGLKEAIVLQQINYCIELNKKHGKNFFEGKYWTYKSIRSWHEKDFDYMSLDTVKRIFSKLENMGYLLVGNFNKDPRDKTKWYTINDEKLEALYKSQRKNYTNFE